MLTSSLQFRQKVYSEKTVEVSKSSIFRSKLKASSVFLLSDLLSLILIISAIHSALSIFSINSFTFPLESYLLLTVTLLLSNYILGLYPGYGIDPVDEIRSLFYSSFATGLLFLALCGKSAQNVSDPLMVCILYPIALFLIISISRRILRKFLVKYSWWGIPAILYGTSKDVQKMAEGLIKNKNIGLKPRVLIESDEPISDFGVDRCLSDVETIEYISEKTNVDHIVIGVSDKNKQYLHDNIKKIRKSIKKLTFVIDTSTLNSLWISSRNLNSINESNEYKLFKKGNLLIKTIFDRIMAIFFLVLSLPIILISSIIVKFSTKGKIFFKSKRIGKNNDLFDILKFRSMIENGDNILREFLKENPELKNEFYKFHKLKKDPRITRAGKHLRKFYIDEIPQFFNVLFGSMSIVGHRPVEEGEYIGPDEYVKIIAKLPPGLTGLWQVTDSYTATFDRRVLLNVSYIRNWSFFLDIYIIAKTVSWVFKGKGK